ncbi:hypothetical protein PFICI_13033 [Pestalotiopsis fici W106-1]|uniref:Uncharacterized protein n=1 Tax=Pestalotiopsis fici (strain W106-1 / CGMCC3.15140) TaxID=1229662 RepID=W3WLB2_PESFW|nr:uncharacterized protein PFICI_13033 [Pestalotiopsis fici W106-1]ETS74549.1 hypothetical protein PFICI_13033 [Pestalotiopsis fici W106-1]
MAQTPSTTVSLLSDGDQNIARQPDDSANTDLSVSSAKLTSPSGSTTDHPSQLHPGNRRHDTEMPTNSWPDSHTPQTESELQPTQLGQKETQARVPQRHTHGFRHWAWEAVNAVLLLIMIIATIITLRMHDGQPVPDWPLSISINALISTYAFVFKGTMALILTSCIGQLQWSWFRARRPLKDAALFQDAGRSPIAHSFRFTILGIALDPFFQQLAQLTSCTVLSASGQRPFVPRTNFLSISGMDESGGGIPVDLPATLASGYYEPPKLSNFDCSTGNCTFRTDYSTLAFCTKCQDISDKMEVQGLCREVFKFQNGTEYYYPLGAGNKFPPIIDCTYDYSLCDALWVEGDNVDSYHQCNVTSSVDSIWSASYFVDPRDKSKDSPQQLTINSKLRMNQEVAGLSSVSWPNNISLGYDYGIIYAKDPLAQLPSEGCEKELTNNTWSCRGYGAATCFIQPCVQTHTADINSGRFDETLIESSTDVLWASSTSSVYSALSILDKSCISDEERAQLITAGFDLDGHGRWLAYGLNLRPPGVPPGDSTPPPEPWLLKRCVYHMNETFLRILFMDVLPDILEGAVVNDAPSPQQLRVLYNDGKINMTGITSAFENVAQTLTLWVRTNGDPNYSEPVIGQAFHAATCIQANWVWLTLPAVVASLTLIVLALTISITQRRGLPLWKSSPLAFLFHGPGGSHWVDEAIMVAPPRPKAKATDLSTEAGMESMAARIWVSLEGGDVAPRLRQVGMRRNSEP